MEHDVGAIDVRLHRLAVADVDLQEARASGGERVREVLGNTAD